MRLQKNIFQRKEQDKIPVELRTWTQAIYLRRSSDDHKTWERRIEAQSKKIEALTELENYKEQPTEMKNNITEMKTLEG